MLARQITDSARKSQDGNDAVDAMARDLQSLLRCCCSSVGLLLPPLYLSLERYLVHVSDAHRVHDVAQLINGRVLQHGAADAVLLELRSVCDVGGAAATHKDSDVR